MSEVQVNDANYSAYTIHVRKTVRGKLSLAVVTHLK